MPITHAFVSAAPPVADPAIVGSAEWNAAHAVNIVNADVDPAAAIAESKLALNFPTHAPLATPVAPNLGGTGIANAAGSTLTLGAATSITGGGTVALGGFTLSVPATGTAALLGVANVFTVKQTIGVHGVSDGEQILASSQRAGDFGSGISQGNFAGHMDPVMFHGYNPPNASGFVAAEQSIYTGYEGYYWVGAPNQYVEWYVSWRNANGVLNGRSFQTSVELNSGHVITSINGDELAFAAGAGTPLYFQVLTSIGTWSIPVYVVGASDAIQLLAKGNAVQANDIFQVQDSLGNAFFGIGGNGVILHTTFPTGVAAWTSYQQNTRATTSTYATSASFATYRDGAGPAFSWTEGMEVTAALRALAVDANTRYLYGGIFTVEVDSNFGKTSSVSVQAYALQAQLVLGAGGTNVVGTAHGVHIGNFGGTGVFNGAGLYIESQTTATTSLYAIYTNLGLNRFGDQISIVGGVDRNQLIVTGFTTQTLPIVHFIDSQTTDSAVREVQRLEARISTAATGAGNGFGPGLSFYAETASNTVYQQQALIAASWIDSINASRKAKLSISVYDGAQRMGIEIESSGTAAKIGFFGHATAAQPAAYTPSNVTPDRSFDADTVLVAELADVVGTLIADLQTMGIVG